MTLQPSVTTVVAHLLSIFCCHGIPRRATQYEMWNKNGLGYAFTCYELVGLTNRDTLHMTGFES
jgi:hypothetical protein